MAVFEDAHDAHDAAQNFLDNAYLSYIVPVATNFDPRTILAPERHTGSGSLQAAFDAVEQRESLFFDETVDLYVLLRAPFLDQDPDHQPVLRSFLQRLVITAEAQAVNGHSSDRDSPPGAEIVYSGAVEDVASPFLAVEPAAEDATDSAAASDHDDDNSNGHGHDERDDRGQESSDRRRHAYALWKVPVYVGRPRMRLQSPAVVFTATATLTAGMRSYETQPRSGSGNILPAKDSYMQSGVPLGINLLDAFASDPMLGGVKPRLSAQRVSRVAPSMMMAPPPNAGSNGGGGGGGVGRGAGVGSQNQLNAVHPRMLRGLQGLRLRIYPVMHTRLRFARPNATPPSPALIALLEIDFTPFFDCEITIDRLELKVADGSVEVQELSEHPPLPSSSNGSVPCRPGDGLGSMLRLPLHCVAHDHVTFMYRLRARQIDLVTVSSNNLTHNAVNKTPTSRDLAITIRATALVRPGVCTPPLTVAWTTAVDFTPPVNPGFGQPRTQSIQRAHRPSQLSIGGGQEIQSLLSPRSLRPDAIPELEAAAAAAAAARIIEKAVPDLGITMTFTGPEGPVYVGDEFRWEIFIVNRGGGGGGGGRDRTILPTTGAAGPGNSNSARTSFVVTAPPNAPLGSPAAMLGARKLALVAIPKRRRNELRVTRPPSAAAAAISPRSNRPGGRSGGGGGKDAAGQAQQPLPLAPVADAVLEEGVTHAMQRASLVDAAEVACLSADVRVGPLAPGACAAVEMRFVALREGVVGVEAVRVVDLASQEHVDIRDLPAVVVQGRREEG